MTKREDEKNTLKKANRKKQEKHKEKRHIKNGRINLFSKLLIFQV